jgi:hypothetical protein
MTKGKAEETPAAIAAETPGKAGFRPTQAQRAFVAAAAGLGVPRRVIRQMLPAAEPGATVSISAHMLRDYFGRELREGMKLVLPLIGARVCQRALSGDDRSAAQAQTLVLNAQGGWKLLGDGLLDDVEDEKPDMSVLSREEFDELERLLAKTMGGKESVGVAASHPARRHRGRGTLR